MKPYKIGATLFTPEMGANNNPVATRLTYLKMHRVIADNKEAAIFQACMRLVRQLGSQAKAITDNGWLWLVDGRKVKITATPHWEDENAQVQMSQVVATYAALTKKNTKGFTLIELIAGMIIIVILSTLLLVRVVEVKHTADTMGYTNNPVYIHKTETERSYADLQQVMASLNETNK